MLHLINRIHLASRSIEMVSVLDLPVDFYIEFQLLNFHCWLVVNRLG